MKSLRGCRRGLFGNTSMVHEEIQDTNWWEKMSGFGRNAFDVSMLYTHSQALRSHVKRPVMIQNVSSPALAARVALTKEWE